MKQSINDSKPLWVHLEIFARIINFLFVLTSINLYIRFRVNMDKGLAVFGWVVFAGLACLNLPFIIADLIYAGSN